MKEIKINRVHLGRNIRRQRKYVHRLTQEQLAEKIRCSAQMISALERGKRELSVKMLLTLCQVLACSPAQLLQGVADE